MSHADTRPRPRIRGVTLAALSGRKRFPMATIGIGPASALSIRQVSSAHPILTARLPYDYEPPYDHAQIVVKLLLSNHICFLSSRASF